MANHVYTEQQTADLRKALATQGVVLPEKIETVSSGSFGICFISEKEALKLFKTSSLPELAGIKERYFRQATQALENVSALAPELKSRGILVPELLGSGSFSGPVQIGTDSFHAWQNMTRLDGQHTIQMVQSLTPNAVDLPAEIAGTMELSRLAAKLHVQVDAAGKKVSNGIDSKWVNFNWTKEIGVDAKTQNLVNSLKKDIEHNSLPQEKAALLHGDFHPHNILKSKGNYNSVLDWDQQKFGRPEEDVFIFMSLRPQGIRDYVQEYNKTADQPLNEKLVVAYALAAATKSYSLHTKGLKVRSYVEHGIREKVPSFNAETDPDTSAYRSQIHELAKRMYELTGSKIYKDTAQDFSSTKPDLDAVYKTHLAAINTANPPPDDATRARAMPSLIPVPRPSSRDRIPVIAANPASENTTASSEETGRRKEGKARGKDSMTRKIGSAQMPRT